MGPDSPVHWILGNLTRSTAKTLTKIRVIRCSEPSSLIPPELERILDRVRLFLGRSGFVHLTFSYFLLNISVMIKKKKCLGRPRRPEIKWASVFVNISRKDLARSANTLMLVVLQM